MKCDIKMPCVDCLCVPVCKERVCEAPYEVSTLSLQHYCSLVKDYFDEVIKFVAGQHQDDRFKAYNKMKYEVYHYLVKGIENYPMPTPAPRRTNEHTPAE